MMGTLEGENWTLPHIAGMQEVANDFFCFVSRDGLDQSSCKRGL